MPTTRSSGYGQFYRKAALRRMDFKSWARVLRPSLGRADPQILPRVGSGCRGTPANAQDALEGAAQEWERLFHAPPSPWFLGNKRGGLNFEHLTNRPHAGDEATVPQKQSWNPDRGVSYDGIRMKYGTCRPQQRLISRMGAVVGGSRYFASEECQQTNGLWIASATWLTFA